jgi:putative transposase
MARQPRFIVPGQPQHVIQRGNNREVIFCTDRDYEYYLEKLEFSSKAHGCDIHAYVLMTNHVHLLISPDKPESLSKMMQTLGRYYVRYFSYHYKRTGTLWEGRYKSSLVSTEQYLLTCMRYIELNPVRAGMVKDPSNYRCSSYHCNALGSVNSLIEPRLEYLTLGLTREERQKNYQGLFETPLNQTTLTEIREAANKSWVLGDDMFKHVIEQQLARRVMPLAKGGDRKSRHYLESVKTNLL